VILVVVAIGVAAWVRTRYLEVEEGYVIPVKWLGLHRRIVYAGPHLRWPGERPGPRIEVRRRDASLQVSDILTHSGLPVTVSLRYRMCFSPKDMNPAELYYPPSEWTEQQLRLFKQGMQGTIEEFLRLASDGKPPQADLAAVFSPFFNTPMSVLCGRLEKRVLKPLGALGIELMPDTLVIDRLTPPAEVVTAYEELLRSNFEATSASRFIQAIRSAAPGVSAMDLAQLYNSILNNVGEVRTIFADGTFRPGSYSTELGPAIAPTGKQRIPDVGNPWPRAESDEQRGGVSPDIAQRNYPLTVEDMALLKALSSQDVRS
jgi:hypothetical protein